MMYIGIDMMQKINNKIKFVSIKNVVGIKVISTRLMIFKAMV